MPRSWKYKLIQDMYDLTETEAIQAYHLATLGEDAPDEVEFVVKELTPN